MCSWLPWPYIMVNEYSWQLGDGNVHIHSDILLSYFLTSPVSVSSTSTSFIIQYSYCVLRGTSDQMVGCVIMPLVGILWDILYNTDGRSLSNRKMWRLCLWEYKYRILWLTWSVYTYEVCHGSFHIYIYIWYKGRYCESYIKVSANKPISEIPQCIRKKFSQCTSNRYNSTFPL